MKIKNVVSIINSISTSFIATTMICLAMVLFSIEANYPHSVSLWLIVLTACIGTVLMIVSAYGFYIHFNPKQTEYLRVDLNEPSVIGPYLRILN